MAYNFADNGIPGLKAAGDLSAKQFHFVKVSAALTVNACSTTGEECHGVLQNKPSAAGMAANVNGYSGNVTKVTTGAAVSAGATLMTNAAGRAITWLTTNHKAGIALSASGGDGQAIEMLQYQSHPDVTATTGTIPLDIAALREVVSNDVGISVDAEAGAGTADGGGYLTKDTTPLLERVNAATDKALRVTWAASDSTEVLFPTVVKPQDLDSAEDLTVHLWAGMAGATDTPTIDIQCFDGVGDTEMGGASGALSDTAGEVSTTIAAANLGASPGFLNISLVPGAHTTDILWVYAAWIEYKRKVN